MDVADLQVSNMAWRSLFVLPLTVVVGWPTGEPDVRGEDDWRGELQEGNVVVQVQVVEDKARVSVYLDHLPGGGRHWQLDQSVGRVFCGRRVLRRTCTDNISQRKLYNI